MACSMVYTKSLLNYVYKHGSFTLALHIDEGNLKAQLVPNSAIDLLPALVFEASFVVNLSEAAHILPNKVTDRQRERERERERERVRLQ